MHPYLPHTQEDIKLMLEKIGVSSVEQLFDDIPHELILDRELNLEPSKSEYEVTKILKNMASMNKVIGEGKNFYGAGAYEHYIPSIIKHIASRQEFLTAYTPYQPEISQGTLQVVFEFQSMICNLTGMDASNASLYDGGTAMAEGMFMAYGKNKKTKVLLSELVNPEYEKVVKTYAKYRGLEVVMIPSIDGQLDLNALESLIDGETSSVILQSPNYLGMIEAGQKIRTLIDSIKTKALLIVSANPTSLGLFKSPGEYGADIVVGEGQPLGNALQFGGPYVGFIATTQKLMRQLPGRIVGQTVDKDGKRAFVLTLQAREQHIRREKATSNITSNQGLNALMATIYMALLGKNGLYEVAKKSYDGAHYLYKELKGVKGVTLPLSEGFFHEFVFETDNAKELHSQLTKAGYGAGVLINHKQILVCVTETKTKEDIDAFVRDIKNCLNKKEEV